MARKKKNIIAIILLLFIFLMGVYFIFSKEKKIVFEEIKPQGEKSATKEIKEEKEKEEKEKIPLSGPPCPNSEGRSFAIVLNQEPATMPLSGIEEADIVIEAPFANPGGITRLLAIYQCKEPEKIGSLRSLRPFMVDLALGFDSILASWGACVEGAERARRLQADWLTPVARPRGVHAFFRDTNIPSPHNAFTSIAGLKREAKNLKMRLKNEFGGYQFKAQAEGASPPPASEIKINYRYPVKWIFDQKSGAYLRFWNGQEAIDRNTHKPIFARNVVLMKTAIGVLRAGVANVKVLGEGKAIVYQQGQEIKATWKKENPKAKLFFFDENGQEINFLPGNIWIEIST